MAGIQTILRSAVGKVTDALLPSEYSITIAAGSSHINSVRESRMSCFATDSSNSTKSSRATSIWLPSGSLPGAASLA